MTSLIIALILMSDIVSSISRNAVAASQERLEQVRVLVRDGQYPAAAVMARELLPLVEAKHGAASAQTADLLDLLSEALRRDGHTNDREPHDLAQRALEIKERLFGRDDPAVAVSLFNIASALYLSGELERARPVFARTLEVRQKTLGAEHPLVAETMDYLGNLLLDLGDEREAESLFQRALEIRQKAFGPDGLDVAWSLSSLAKLRFNTGDYDEALPLYRRALGIREKALRPDHPLVAASVNNVATILEARDDYAGAAPLWERALALRRATLRPGHPLIAAAMERMGSLYLSTGDFAAAGPLFEEALAMREKTLGPDHPDLVWSMENLAELRSRTGELDAAQKLLERGLRIREKALKPDDSFVALSLVGLANLHVRRGDYASARPMYERALAIQEKTLGANHLYVAYTLDSLASLLEATGRPYEAEPVFERALGILSDALGPRNPDVARALNHLAKTRAHLGHRESALEDTLRAEEISREHFRLTGRVLTERQALLYWSITTDGLDLALSLAADGLRGIPDANASVLDALIRSRSLVLDETAARHRLMDDSGNAEVAGLFSSLRAASTQLANLVVRGVGDDPPERYQGRLEHALEAKARLERTLAEKSAAFRESQAVERVGLQQVAEGLPDDAALVAYVRYSRDGGAQEHYLAFVLRGSPAEPLVVPLGPAADVDASVLRWRREIQRGSMTSGHAMNEAEAECRRAGEALRRKIWDPLAAGLRGSARVFIVPDGALHLVSIAALPADGGGYLVESGPLVHYLSTERDLAHVAPPRSSGEVMLALGQPDFDRPGPQDKKVPMSTFRGEPSECGGFQSMRFGALPATLREVQQVADLWQRQPGARAVKLTGALATEEAFKRQAPGKRILHIATHGFFLGKGCVAGAASSRGIGSIVPTAGTRAAEERRLPVQVGENPLLLSGLALAGANQRRRTGQEQEDGILTAEEIAAMDLSGIEWAVLSACDTGTGEVVAGEGVFGLRRALQLAGAGTVIMSLWSVEDEAARRWMGGLYEGRLERDLGTAEAVRDASLEVLRERRAKNRSTHPFYWAGFIAAGDWRRSRGGIGLLQEHGRHANEKGRMDRR